MRPYHPADVAIRSCSSAQTGPECLAVILVTGALGQLGDRLPADPRR